MCESFGSQPDGDSGSGHRAVSALRASGHLSGVITQNVDGLHQAAGARRVIELHGGLDRVVCLSQRHAAASGTRPVSLLFSSAL